MTCIIYTLYYILALVIIFSKVKIDFQVTTFAKFASVQWVLCGRFLSCLFTGLWSVKS
jgi:hypothetical protein